MHTIDKDISNYLFNVYTDPTDPTKPFPIKEIVKIGFKGRCAHVHYLDLNNRPQVVRVFSYELV